MAAGTPSVISLARKKSTLLQLEYDQSLIPDGGSLVLKSLSTFQKTSRFEPAGHSFHELALILGGFSHGGEEEDVVDESAEVDEGPAIDSTFAWESGKQKKKSKDSDQEQDHYALIGLAHLRYLATEDQIRKAYRDAALKFHPDKMQAALMLLESEEERAKKKESIETRFKAVQAAYEILMDPVKRRNFDSMDEFDDTIPSECSAADFFKVFGPVFERNSKWSAIQPCPLAGDENSPMDEVDKFYDFWWGFKSWREFPNEDEHDLESAEGREHKRWMERQNSKLREKAKKEEVQRIRRLVELAFRKDPRLQKRKEDEKKEKLRKKELKNASKKAAEEEERIRAEEARKKAEEDQKKAAEEASLLKKQKEKEKKLLRKERARLRTIAAECILGAPIGQARQTWGVPEEDIETLCQKLEMEQLQALCNFLETLPEPGRRALTLRRWLQVVEEGGKFSGNIPEGNEEAEAQSTEEFDAFIKNGGSPGVAREPTENGAGNHPEAPGKVPEANGVGNGKSKSPQGKESKSSKDSGKKPAQKPRSKPWEKEEVDLLRKAVSKFPKGTSQRWEVISDYIGTGRSADEISRAVKTELLAKPDDSKAYEQFLEKRKKTAKPITSELSTRDDSLASATASEGVTPGKSKSGSSVQPATPPPQAEKPRGTEKGSGPSPSEGEASGWSDVQERALVKAVKTFPKDTENRWDRIAAAIPGKTKAACVRKYNALKQSFRTAKDASGNTN